MSFIAVMCKKDDTTLPVVKTYTPLYIASTKATIGITVESDGGSGIVCGVYLGISENPETTGTQLQMGSDTGVYRGQVTGLLPDTPYYVKAYAINAKGEGLGEEVSFTTPATIQDFDNTVYETVKIGTQVWMAKNLKTTHYLNGELIGTTTPSTLDITSENSPAYQWSYSGDDANTTIYGKLYTWYAITDTRNACPAGWHVPTDTEWTTLENTLGGYSVAGSRMKEYGNSHWLAPYNLDASNESIFSALPGGYRDGNGVFSLIQNNAYFWSSSESEATKSWARTLDAGNPAVGRTGLNKNSGASVRCIKD